MPAARSQLSFVPSFFKRFVVGLAVTAGTLVSTLSALALIQDRLIYLPRTYLQQSGGNDHHYCTQLLNHPYVVPFSYRTSQSGVQTAFMVNNNLSRSGPSTPSLSSVKPANTFTTQSQPAKPQPRQRIWFLLGGNAGLALDWLHTIVKYYDQYDTPEQQQHLVDYIHSTFVLVDYPSYGMNAAHGIKPTPTSIQDSLQCALESVIKLYSQQSISSDDKQPIEICLAGHSLGAAAATQFAHDLLLYPSQQHTSTDKSPTIYKRLPANYKLTKLVLLSPFTTMKDMVQHLFTIQLPLIDRLLNHAYDNVKPLEAIATQVEADQQPAVTIIHGTADEIVPVSMGRKLAAAANAHQRQLCSYIEVEHATHNDIIEAAERQLFAAWSSPARTIQREDEHEEG